MTLSMLQTLDRGGYAHDETLWPIVVNMIPSRAIDGELDAHMRYVDRLYARGEPFFTATFISLKTRSTSEQRARMGQRMKDTQEQMRALNRGAVFIAGSTLFRFTLSGVMLLSPMPIPYEVCTTSDEAAQWLRGALRDEGLPIPTGLESSLRTMEQAFTARGR